MTLRPRDANSHLSECLVPNATALLGSPKIGVILQDKALDNALGLQLFKKVKNEQDFKSHISCLKFECIEEEESNLRSKSKVRKHFITTMDSYEQDEH